MMNRHRVCSVVSEIYNVLFSEGRKKSAFFSHLGDAVAQLWLCDICSNTHKVFGFISAVQVRDDQVMTDIIAENGIERARDAGDGHSSRPKRGPSLSAFSCTHDRARQQHMNTPTVKEGACSEHVSETSALLTSSPARPDKDAEVLAVIDNIPSKTVWCRRCLLVQQLLVGIAPDLEPSLLEAQLSPERPIVLQDRVGFVHEVRDGDPRKSLVGDVVCKSRVPCHAMRASTSHTSMARTRAMHAGQTGGTAQNSRPTNQGPAKSNELGHALLARGQRT